jgi:hypothetical protein
MVQGTRWARARRVAYRRGDYGRGAGGFFSGRKVGQAFQPDGALKSGWKA